MALSLLAWFSGSHTESIYMPFQRMNVQRLRLTLRLNPVGSKLTAYALTPAASINARFTATLVSVTL